MSKFDYNYFCGDYNCLCISKEKYTKEEALKLAKVEFEYADGYFAIADAFVRHRAGVDEDGERRVCWWLEFYDAGRNCPVWCIRYVQKDKLEVDKKVEEGLEYIPLEGVK